MNDLHKELLNLFTSPVPVESYPQGKTSLSQPAYDSLFELSLDQGLIEWDSDKGGYLLTSKGRTALDLVSLSLEEAEEGTECVEDVPSVESEIEEVIAQVFPESNAEFEYRNSDVLKDLMDRLEKLEKSSKGPIYGGKAGRFMELVQRAMDLPELELDRISPTFCTRVLHMVSIMDTGNSEDQDKAVVNLIHLIFSIF